MYKLFTVYENLHLIRYYIVRSGKIHSAWVNYSDAKETLMKLNVWVGSGQAL